MKTIILALATAGIATASIGAAPITGQNGGWPAPLNVPAPVKAEAADAPQRAPDMPVTPPPAPAAARSSDALAKLGDGTPPKGAMSDHWNELEDTQRYLLIMGTVDGYGAAGAGAPCFPGNDNTSLDAKLKASGFVDADPTTLPEAMARIGAAKEQCTGQQTRGYPNKLLKGMPDDHIAIYLTGVIRAYSRIKPCETKNQGYAAAAVAASIFMSPDDAQPIAVMTPALAEGCKGPKQ